MPLVEVIQGERTDAATLAAAVRLSQRMGKTPIVVNDSRGFYTSRVFSTYVGEGLTLLAEGVAPALIENAGRMAGMPVGPLALADEVSLELMARIRRQTAADLGSAYQRSAIDEVCERMVDSALGRLGKKAGKGFYEYPQGATKHLWAGLAGLWFDDQKHQPAWADWPERADDPLITYFRIRSFTLVISNTVSIRSRS